MNPFLSGEFSPQREELLYVEGYRALEQAAKGGHGVSLPGNVPNPPGHVPGSPALGDPALDYVISFQTLTILWFCGMQPFKNRSMH